MRGGIDETIPVIPGAPKARARNQHVGFSRHRIRPLAPNASHIATACGMMAPGRAAPDSRLASGPGQGPCLPPDFAHSEVCNAPSLAVRFHARNRSVRGRRSAGGGAGLSQQARHHRRAVRSGGLNRSARAHRRVGLGEGDRQVLRRGEPSRRGPADRRQRGRQGRAGRPHAADGDQLRHGGQSHALQEDRLRPGEGLPADRDHGAPAVHPAGQSRPAGPFGRRTSSSTPRTIPAS